MLSAGTGVNKQTLHVETLLGWHKTAVQQNKKLAVALSGQTGEEESVATSHQYQKLSVHLMKGDLPYSWTESLTSIKKHCDRILIFSVLIHICFNATKYVYFIYHFKEGLM